MAEEFHTGVCSGSWWNAARGGFDGPPMSAAAAVSCSAAATEVGSFGWALEVMESKARSGEESAGAAAAASVSGGETVTFHGTPGGHASDPMVSGGFLMEQTAPVSGSSGLASSSMDWSQAFLRSNRRAEGGFHAMLHDNLSSRTYLYQEEPSCIDSDQIQKATESLVNPFKDFNHGFMTQQSHLDSAGGDTAHDSGFQGVSFACPSTLLHDLLDQDMKPQTSAFMSSPAGYRSSSGHPSRLPHFLKAATSPLKQRHPSTSTTDHLQFPDDVTPFWNASAEAGDSVSAGFCSSTQTQFFTQQAFGEKPSHSTSTITAGKPNSEGSARDSNSAKPAFKKPRIETPSPLPSFKVRKEKLGDRITALQQLVSPFGKTDTASVLHEAIEYIKFLHEQVGVLSTPYLKNGAVIEQQQQQASDKSKDVDGRPKQDLSSRGLCLVPISITFPVVNEPSTADFWTPTFGGTYR